jgi:hypothetical protein
MALPESILCEEEVAWTQLPDFSVRSFNFDTTLEEEIELSPRIGVPRWSTRTFFHNLAYHHRVERYGIGNQ